MGGELQLLHGTPLRTALANVIENAVASQGTALADRLKGALFMKDDAFKAAILEIGDWHSRVEGVLSKLSESSSSWVLGKSSQGVLNDAMRHLFSLLPKSFWDAARSFFDSSLAHFQDSVEMEEASLTSGEERMYAIMSRTGLLSVLEQFVCL